MRSEGLKNLYVAPLQCSCSLFNTYLRPQDIFNIAPKRPNWDLKREMEKKLAKLERKTQESIHTLIREQMIILPL